MAVQDQEMVTRQEFQETTEKIDRRFDAVLSAIAALAQHQADYQTTTLQRFEQIRPALRAVGDPS